MAKAKPTITDELFTKARKLLMKYHDIDVIEQELKRQNADYEVLEKEVVNMMADIFQDGKMGKSFDVTEHHKATLVIKPKPRILQGQEEKAHQWIIDAGYPAAVKKYVFPQTLEHIMKEIAEERKKTVADVVGKELLGVMDVFTVKSVQFKRK